MIESVIFLSLNSNGEVVNKLQLCGCQSNPLDTIVVNLAEDGALEPIQYDVARTEWVWASMADNWICYGGTWQAVVNLQPCTVYVKWEYRMRPM